MKTLQWLLIIVALFMSTVKFSLAKELMLGSQDFQKEFLQNITQTMQEKTSDYFKDVLMHIFQTAYKYGDKYEEEWRLAIASSKLEPKISFIKHYLEMEEHKDANRDYMYALHNIEFLKKFKDNLQQMQKESFKEKQQLRYYYLCKHLQETTNKSNPKKLISNLNPFSKVRDYIMRGASISSINIKNFGKSLYEDINKIGAAIIDDYLIVICKLLREILAEKSTSNTEILSKILVEIDAVYNIPDFFTKHQRLYDYLQNHLALDFEKFKNSPKYQHEFEDIYNKLKEKGLDLLEVFFFGNLEFIDYLLDAWRRRCPQGDLSGFDEHSRPLKKVQDSYDALKEDFGNSSKYDDYLQSVKLLHEQTQRDKEDSSHIYEILYKASKNIGHKRIATMKYKCNEIKNQK